MKQLILTILTLLWIHDVQETDALRILFIGPVGTRSHKNYYSYIIEALVENNHHVTLITPFQSESIRKNVTEVLVPEGDFSKFDLNLFKENYKMSLDTVEKYYSLCYDTVESPQVHSLLQEKFDVALFSLICSECYLWLIHRLKIPFISVGTLELLSDQGVDTGNPVFSSITQYPFLDYEYPFTFIQRLQTALMNTGGYLYKTYSFNRIDIKCREMGVCPEDMPHIYDIARNSSMLFVNSVRTLQSPPMPYVPAVVPIGGIHCRPSKQLPKDLEEWIKGAGEEGFIYFSLGSIVKPSTLPEKNRLMFIEVLKSLKQRVLWKWDKESMADLPPNVLLKKWVPQQDILGHPQLRLFISHSGLFSTQESLYHGKPLLGLPVYADQLSNARSVERQGWGKVILWEDMTEEILLKNINSIIDSKEMQEIVQAKSLLMKDQPIPPKSLVAYWTEYVVRHRGAAHLRCPAADMPWYRIYNVDVWLTVVAASVLLLWLIIRLIKAFISCLIPRRVKSKKD